MEAPTLAAYVPHLAADWLSQTPHHTWRTVHGSLALIDISGFTALTERLARRGRIGAEQLSDLLDVTFGALLECADDEDGDLVKWGGDALLLLFDGDHHADRAARATVRMRTRLAELTRARGRSIALEMSAGIHSGDIHLALVGDPEVHRELLVIGPAASTVAQLEKSARAGEIIVSHASASVLPAAVIGERAGEGRLLVAEPPARHAPPAPRYTAPEPDVGSLVFPTIRSHLMMPTRDSEHRLITVAFIRFSGSDSLLERDGAEALVAALDGVIRVVQGSAMHHGVTIVESDVDVNGGRLLLTAGAPLSSDHEEERMLRVARAVVEHEGPLELSVGISRGNVFAGDFGPIWRRTYSVKGDAVNLAARIMAHAAVGDVVAAFDVVDRAQSTFEIESVAPFRVKGKFEPVVAVRVGARNTHADARLVKAGDASQHVFVGRDNELAVLHSSAQSAARGHGGITVVSGSPGVGKSRLVDELLLGAPHRVVVTRCEPYDTATPYRSWRTILIDALGVPAAATPEQLRRALDDAVNERVPALRPWLPLIGEALNLEYEPTPETLALAVEFRRDARERAVVELLAAQLPTPTIIIFDDAHHMDDASVSMLHHVARDVESRPWCVVVTRRNNEGGFVAETGVVELRLASLSAAMTRRLVRALTDDAPLPPTDVAAIVARAQGNPLFAAGLVRTLREGAETAALPESVEALLTSEIDVLAPRDRRTLRCAAVLGMGFTTEELQYLVDDVSVTSIENSLAAFLRADGPRRWRFAHQLARDTAYEGLPFRRRRELHGRAGDALAAHSADPTEIAEVLSLHYLHAGKSELAWNFARVAGQRAADKYAYASAEELFARATTAGSRLRDVNDRERAEVLISLGEAQRRVGHIDPALRSFRAARQRLPHQPCEQASVLAREASVHRRVGRYAAAMRSAGRGLALLGDAQDVDSERVRSELEMMCSGIRAHQGRHEEALLWARRAENHAQRAGDLEADAHAAAMIHVTLLMLGRPDRRYGERALRRYEDVGDRLRQSEALNNLALLAWTEGRGDEALTQFRYAHELATQAGDAFQAAATAVNVGDVLLRQGRFVEAEDIMREVLPDLRALRAETFEAIARRVLGLALVERGMVAEGRAEIERARGLQQSLRERDELVETDVALAWVLLLEGAAEAAAELAVAAGRRAGEVDAEHLLPLALRVAGAARLDAGNLLGAESVLDRALSVADEQGSVERGFIAAELEQVALLKGSASVAAERHAQASAAWDALGFVGSNRYPRG